MFDDRLDGWRLPGSCQDIWYQNHRQSCCDCQVCLKRAALTIVVESGEQTTTHPPNNQQHETDLHKGLLCEQTVSVQNNHVSKL